jgi:hypothetical protein
MTFREIIVVYSETQTKHLKTQYGQLLGFYVEGSRTYSNPLSFFFCWSETESLGTFALNGPVYQLQMIDERNGAFHEIRIGRKIEVLRENLQFYFDHHKSHMNL